MKKIFLGLFFILFTTLNSEASIIVNYGPGGIPSTAQSGIHKVSISGQYYGFGRNALALPQNIARQRVNRINRNIRCRNSIAGNYPVNQPMNTVMTPPVVVAPPISRFNRNYRISTPQRTYTRNGITYYN